MPRFRTTLAFFFARGFLGVGIVGGLLRAIAALVTGLSGDPVVRDVDLDLDRATPFPGDGRADSVNFNWSGDVSVTIDDPDTSLLLINALPLIALGLAVAVTSWLLLVVVVDVQRGVPFEAKAARRLEVSAAVVTIAALTHPLLAAWADAEVIDASGRRGPDFAELAGTGFVMDGAYAPWLLVAALLAAFAHAFGTGRRLADDTAGLV